MEVFRGSALVAADSNSWTATLQRQRYNAQGVLISTDTISDVAKRFTLFEAPAPRSPVLQMLSTCATTT